MNARTDAPCPICSTKNYEVLFEPWLNINDPALLYGAASGVQGAQRVVNCRSCEMQFESPRFSEETILTSYKNAKDDGHDTQYELRVLSFENSLKSLQNKGVIPSDALKVLDVGAAGGAFLEAAKRVGYIAVGLEPSHVLVEKGKKRGLSLTQGTIENHSLSGERFDLITLWDVIEHVTDPKAALIQLKPLFKENGTLLLNIPDHGTWMAKLFGKKFWWILSVHLHFFSRRSITRLCKAAGYEVYYAQKYWQVLSFGYLLDIADKLHVPLAKFVKKILPASIQRIPIKYTASQLTVLAKPTK